MFDFYLEHEYWFAAIQLILAMLGMGATLAPADFLRVAADPKGVSVGTVLQLVVVPLVAFGFISVIDGAGQAVGLAVGLAICASIPGGTVSNIFTYFARGHIALSIALTAVATVACLITTPIVLGLLITQHLPENFVMPAGRIATEIGLCLLLPLVVGMLYLRFLPGSAALFSRWCIRGSLFVIGLIVIGALGAGRLDLQAFGLVNIGWVLAFALCLLLISYLVPKLLGNNHDDIVAINIEITVRNTNLGLLIKASLFPAVVGVADPVGDNVLFTILLYGGIMLILGGTLIGVYRTQAGFRDALK
ncbi:MAG: bile acid:sodium symporter family protein [Nevskiales bacterium]